MSEPLALWSITGIVVVAVLLFAAVARFDRWSERRDARLADRDARHYLGLNPPPLDLPDHAADLADASPVATLPWPVPGVSRNRGARNRAAGAKL